MLLFVSCIVTSSYIRICTFIDIYISGNILLDPLIQLSIDESRHILYARTEKGTLQVFDLGQDGKGIGKVASVPLHTIVHHASHIAR